MDCIFCKIAAGEIPSAKVYENEYVYAFRDINPQAAVHVLVIPRAHIASVNEVNAENAPIVAEVLKAIAEVAKICGLDNGYRVISNVGEHGCQSVKHLHFHVIGGQQLSENMA